MDWSRSIKPIAAGVLCAALACCAASGGERIWIDKKNGFQITLPDGVYATGADYTDNAYDKGWKAYTAMGVYKLKEGDGLRSYFEMDDSKQFMRGLTLTDIQRCTLAGASAFKLEVIDADYPDGYRRIVYYVVSGGRGYTIVLGAPKSEFEKHAAEFDAIVKSFTLLKSE